MKSAAAVQFVINVCLCGAVNVERKIIDVNNLAALYRSSGAQQVTSGSIQRYQIHQDAHISQPTVPWTNGSEGDEDFDCTIEVDILKYAWSNQKKLWCCRRYLVGCSPTGAESVTMNATNHTPCKKSETNITKVFEVDVNGANSWPVPNEWACGLICQGRSADGCCSFEGPPADVSAPYSNAKGVCYWLPASAGSIRLTKEAKGWRSSRCLAGFGTAKCVGWQEGLCVANLEQDKLLMGAAPLKDQQQTFHLPTAMPGASATGCLPLQAPSGSQKKQRAGDLHGALLALELPSASAGRRAFV